MSNQSIQTVSTAADKWKVYGAFLLVFVSFVSYYLFEKQGVLIQSLVLVGGLVAAAVLYLMSEAGHRLIALFRDSWRELKKVVWPERKEATQLTLYVFGFVVLMAFVLWTTDKTIEWVLYDLVLGWRK